MRKKLDDDKCAVQLAEKLREAKCTECACFSLRKTTRSISQLYDKALRPVGLRSTQFSLLTATTMLKSVTVTRLAEITVMDRTTLTRNLRPLEKKGLVNISRGDDRRIRIVTMTAHGRKVLSKALPLWSKAQAHIVSALGRERWNTLHATLQELVALGGKM